MAPWRRGLTNRVRIMFPEFDCCCVLSFYFGVFVFAVLLLGCCVLSPRGCASIGAGSKDDLALRARAGIGCKTSACFQIFHRCYELYTILGLGHFGWNVVPSGMEFSHLCCDAVWNSFYVDFWLQRSAPLTKLLQRSTHKNNSEIRTKSTPGEQGPLLTRGRLNERNLGFEEREPYLNIVYGRHVWL